MTEDWIHYFDYTKPNIINAFECEDSERLCAQISSLHNVTHLDWDSYDIALIGIPDSRNSVHKGCDKTPDQVRNYLWGLRKLSKPLNIIDLGNLRGNTIDDRYKALEEIVSELSRQNIIPIIIGGSQDYTLPMAKGINKHLSKYNLAVIDSKIDWLLSGQDYSASSFLGHLCNHTEIAPFDLSIIGAQRYLYSEPQENKIHSSAYEIYRLGQIRQFGCSSAEPFLRDADLVSVDMTAVRQSDQPSHIIPQPNGLSAEELCQLMWYAGQSDRLKCFGIFELDNQTDTNNLGTSLKAQSLWHILEGIALRYKDYPVKELDTYRQFFVFLEDYELEIKFYNNPENDRWWVEIPVTEGNIEVISCGRADFEVASSNEIPEKWFRFIQKKDCKSAEK